MIVDDYQRRGEREGETTIRKFWFRYRLTHMRMMTVLAPFIYYLPMCLYMSKACPLQHQQQLDMFASSFLADGKYMQAYRASHPENKIKHKTTMSRLGKVYYHKHKADIDARMDSILAQNSQLCSKITLDKLEKCVNKVLDNKGAKDSDLLKAVEVAARLLGLNAPDKSEVTTNLSLTQLISDFALPAQAPAKQIEANQAQVVDVVDVTP
jgi:hypothetical protein